MVHVQLTVREQRIPNTKDRPQLGLRCVPLIHCPRALVIQDGSHRKQLKEALRRVPGHSRPWPSYGEDFDSTIVLLGKLWVLR